MKLGLLPGSVAMPLCCLDEGITTTALLHSPLKGIKLAEKAVRFSSQRISQREKKRNNMMKSQPKHNKEIRLDIV